jgi:hypothetical protein
MDDIQQNKIMTEGHLSKAILEDETFKNAVRKAEENILNDWKQATTVDAREECHYKLVGLRSILSQLKIPVVTMFNLIEKLSEEAEEVRYEE